MESVSKIYKGLWLFTALSFLLLVGCELPYNPPPTDEESQYVVEGYIEAGESDMPAYVVVTKSLPFITELNAEIIAETFVNDAMVEVNDGQKIVELTNVCLEDLPPDLAEAIRNALGLLPTFTGLCIYIDLNDDLDRRVGGQIRFAYYPCRKRAYSYNYYYRTGANN